MPAFSRASKRCESIAWSPPTPKGGCHTLWVLGHLAYIEALVVHGFMLGERNPLAEWEELFDGDPRVV